jgi:hypothetical protein
LFDFSEFQKDPPRQIPLLQGLKYSTIIKGDLIPFIIFILIVCIIPVFMILSKKESRLPFIDMAKIDGLVTKVSVINNQDKDILINYSFNILNNRTYYGKSKIKADSEYSSLNVGGYLPIVFDPKDPVFNGIEGVMGKDNPLKIIMIFPLIGSMIVLFLIYPLFHIKKSRSIFKKGIITNGEIVYIKDIPDNLNKGLTGMYVYFRFKCLDGSSIESNFQSKNYWLLNQFKIGSPITVAYLEKKPKKNIILDCFYR